VTLCSTVAGLPQLLFTNALLCPKYKSKMLCEIDPVNWKKTTIFSPLRWIPVWRVFVKYLKQYTRKQLCLTVIIIKTHKEN